MFKISKDEARAIQKLNKKNQLRVLSRKKKSRGKTYQVMDDDYASLNIISQLRNMTLAQIFAEEYQNI